ncbi:MAG: hypothetical protein AB1374_08780 [Bacillota bacterium]
MKQVVLPYAVYISGPAWKVFGYIAELCAEREATLKDYLKVCIH